MVETARATGAVPVRVLHRRPLCVTALGPVPWQSSECVNCTIKNGCPSSERGVERQGDRPWETFAI